MRKSHVPGWTMIKIKHMSYILGSSRVPWDPRNLWGASKKDQYRCLLPACGNALSGHKDKKSLFLSAQLVVHEHPAHILFNRVQPKNSAPMFWARFSGNTLLICPPGLSAMSTTSSWTASWSLVPPVKIPTRARRRAQTARAHAQTRNGEKRPAKNGRQRPGKRRPRVWHNRRASRCRGTRPTPGKEPGWESCPKPSPGLRPPYPGYHRIPSSPNWTHCAWRLAT